MRIDKFLANQGIGSRTQVKQYIKNGCITINNETCLTPDTHIDETKDMVCYNGKALNYKKFSYYLLNKPAGVVSATHDPLHKTVLDLLSGVNTRNLFPVGRLDIDTEGLLLITNDGELSHRLLSPGKHVAKTYFARINGEVTSQHIKLFQLGIDIGDDKPTLPATLQIQSVNKETHESEILLSITEGRYHQVKRMFEAVGMTVTYLKRLSMGSLTLPPELACGDFMELSPEDIKQNK